MGTAAYSIWDGFAQALSERWRVIRYDRRGDGDSDPGTPESHTFSNYADDALAVLDACGQGTASVCGMAFGARVAIRLALDSASRVEKLILFDATGAVPAPESERLAGQRKAARLREAAGVPPTPVDPRWFHRRDRSGKRLHGHALAGHPGWLPGLHGVGARTLVACGEQDPNLQGSLRIAREIPRSTFTLMPMTGHASLLERPDLVLALLRQFLETPG